MNSSELHANLHLATLAIQSGELTGTAALQALRAWSQDPSRTFDEFLSAAGLKAETLTQLHKVLNSSLVSKDTEPPSSAEVTQLTSEVTRLQLVGDQTATGTRADASPSSLSSPSSRASQESDRGGKSASQQTMLDVDDETTSGKRLDTFLGLNDSSDRFRIVREHARGGLGIISIAFDRELNREVAVKELQAERINDVTMQRFLTEARVTAMLDHPGIPPVYALGCHSDGRPFYVMRWIDGKTLKRAIAEFHKDYPFPDVSSARTVAFRQLLNAFISVCKTVSYAHSLHVLHRDLKPSNIMLGEYGETLVLDWGLAKNEAEPTPFSLFESRASESKRSADDATLTGTGSVMGTPHYMSPEQAHGEWDSVNARSDVYSLGATLHTILTGKPPFEGKTRDAVLEQVKRGAILRPRTLDRRVSMGLESICLKAMAFERENRFASPAQMAAELEHWLADEPTSIVKESTSRRWQRWLRRNDLALVLYPLC